MKNVKSLICGLAITLLVLMLPGSALASPGDQGTMITVGGYQVSLGFVEPAKTGTNSIHVTILDEMGMPVSNAEVEISAMPIEETDGHVENMQPTEPAMGGMEGVDHSLPTPAPLDSMAGMAGMDHPAPTAVATDSMHGDESGHGVEEGANDTHTEETVMAILEPGHESGEYAGEISFAASGHWMLTVHFSTDGETLEAAFPVDVTGSSPSGGILAGFAGLNAVLIGVAAITRRKPASA